MFSNTCNLPPFINNIELLVKESSDGEDACERLTNGNKTYVLVDSSQCTYHLSEGFLSIVSGLNANATLSSGNLPASSVYASGTAYVSPYLPFHVR